MDTSPLDMEVLGSGEVVLIALVERGSVLRRVRDFLRPTVTVMHEVPGRIMGNGQCSNQ